MLAVLHDTSTYTYKYNNTYIILHQSYLSHYRLRFLFVQFNPVLSSSTPPNPKSSSPVK